MKLYRVRIYKITRGKCIELKKAIVMADSACEADEKFLKAIGGKPEGAYVEARECRNDVYTF